MHSSALPPNSVYTYAPRAFVGNLSMVIILLVHHTLNLRYSSLFLIVSRKTSWWIQSHQGYWPPWHLRFWSPPGGRPELGSSATNLVARPPPGGNARALFLRTLDTKVPCGTCGCKTWKHIYILSSRTLTLLNIHIAIFNEVQYIFPQNALPSI